MFDKEIINWAANPLINPQKLLSSFKQNQFDYLSNFNGIDTPIDFCKKTFLPNHLTWFLTDKNFKKHVNISKNTKTTKEFFENLIEATAKLYKIQYKMRKLLETKEISDFSSDIKIIQSSVNLLTEANKYEVLRVSYNSQIRDFIDKKLQRFNLSQKELHIVLTPTFGTIYTFLAEEYLKNNKNMVFIGKNYFGNSLKDAEIKFSNWKDFVDKELIEKRNKKLKKVRSEKEKLYKKNKELVWIDGLITFDNLIDKLIVYSGILRHDTFLKLALFNKSALQPEEIFRTNAYFPKERSSNH